VTARKLVFDGQSTSNTEVLAGSAELQVESIQFNLDIATEVFQLASPVGTIVYEDMSKKNFIVTENNPRDSAAYEGHAADRLKRPSVLAESGIGVRRKMAILLTGFVIVCLAALLIRERLKSI
jgi:hypothetical protein